MACTRPPCRGSHAKDCKDPYCPPLPSARCQPLKRAKYCQLLIQNGNPLKPKDGEKQSKKFGLKLFRLSFKKDKTKQLANFSAQFPPEEWPGETRTRRPPSLGRVEMEIIRRINPDLTVETSCGTLP